MSFFSRFKKQETAEEKRNKREIERGNRIYRLSSAKQKVKEQKEKYAIAANERYAASIAEKERALNKETWKATHPRAIKVLEGAERTGGRIIRFGGQIAKEGAGSYAKTSRSLRGSVRIRQRVPTRRRSFVAPTGQDNSLSGGVARNDWAGESTVMDRDFFGSQQQKDLLGVQGERDLLGSNNEKKKNQRYY